MVRATLGPLVARIISYRLVLSERRGFFSHASADLWVRTAMLKRITSEYWKLYLRV